MSSASNPLVLGEDATVATDVWVAFDCNSSAHPGQIKLVDKVPTLADVDPSYALDGDGATLSAVDSREGDVSMGVLPTGAAEVVEFFNRNKFSTWSLLKRKDLLVGTVFGPLVERVHTRVRELGRLGLALFAELEPSDLYPLATLRAEIAHLGSTSQGGFMKRGIAYSILCMKYPIQLNGMEHDVRWLADRAVAPLDHSKAPEPVNMAYKEARKLHFPLKNTGGAMNKANVFLSEVDRAMAKVDPGVREEMHLLSGFMAGKLSDDQAAMAYMLAAGLQGRFENASELAVRMSLDVPGCTALNLVLKSLGLNGTLEGAMVCEGKCLRGRAGDAKNMRDDWEYRLDATRVHERVHHVPIDALRDAVRSVFALELPKGKLDYPTLQETWTRRWLWCVNGAHNKNVELFGDEFVISDPALKGHQLHRRVFAEHLVEEPISLWPATSYFNLSLKLENGATRAIYGGDSISYFAFEHLLRPVEGAWVGRRVILDPGAIGTYGMQRRLKRMHAKNSGIHVMLDYDDFNSRHSTVAQEMVVEELIAHVGYDKDLGAKLIGSFREQYLIDPETREPRKVEGTLMSGHRATTFINSVLNYAYMAASYPPVKDMQSMHVGDDVYVKANGYSEAYALLSACEDAGLAMNPVKQSVGQFTAEFLRVAYRERHCVGYLIRCIASCVSGNWASDLKLNFGEGVRTIISHAWTLGNRSACNALGSLLKVSLKRLARVTGKIADKLLVGDWSLSGQANRWHNSDTYEIFVHDKRSKWERRLDEEVRNLSNSATTDYLSFHASPLELYALKNAMGDVSRLMKRASYGKTMASRLVLDDVREDISVRKHLRLTRGVDTADKVWDRDSFTGVLSGFPLIQLVKESLSKDVIADLVHGLTGRYYLDPYDLERVAWGEIGLGCSVRGRLSFSDASTMAKRSMRELVITMYDCFV